MQTNLIYNRKPTLLQSKTMQIMVANGGKMPLSKAMRKAGYSEAMARNSQKFSRSKIFKDYLEEAGLTDEVLARKHKELIEAVKFEKLVFTYHQDGRKKIPFTDIEIKKIIERVPGCKLLYINDGSSKLERTAHFTSSDYHIVGSALNMAYRVKGYYNVDNYPDPIPKHELSPEDKEILNKLFNDNKSES